jgi:glycosyltransferase 2 family protein
MYHSRLRKLLPLALAAIVLALVGQLLYSERASLLAYPWQIHWPYLALASLGHALATGGTFLVWHSLMRRLAGPTAPDWRANFAIYYTTTLAKRIPGTVWYAAGRVWLYEQVGVGMSLTLVALVLESAVLFLAGVLFLLMLLPFAWAWPGVAALSLSSLPAWLPPALVGLVLALLWPGVLEWGINLVRRRLGRETLRLQVSYRDLLAWTALNLGVWLAAGVGFFGVVNVVYPVPLSDLGLMLLIGTLAVLFGLVSFVVPVLPVVKEATIAALLALYMPLAVALVVAIIYRLWWTLNDAAWALLASRLAPPSTLDVTSTQPEVT